MKTKIVAYQYLANNENNLLAPFDMKEIFGALDTPQDAINEGVKHLNAGYIKGVKGIVKLTIEFIPIKPEDLK